MAWVGSTSRSSLALPDLFTLAAILEPLLSQRKATREIRHSVRRIHHALRVLEDSGIDFIVVGTLSATVLHQTGTLKERDGLVDPPRLLSLFVALINKP
jgi:hypothetical protein